MAVDKKCDDIIKSIFSKVIKSSLICIFSDENTSFLKKLLFYL